MRQAFPAIDVSGVAADLATAEGATTLLAEAPDADILVNNLGTAWPKPFAELTDDDWLNIFQINVMSGVRMTRHYLPRMVGRGWGRVVFVSSESGVKHPQGDDRLRDDQDGAARDLARPGRIGRGHGRHRKCRAAGADPVRDPRQLDDGPSQGGRRHHRGSRAGFSEGEPADHADRAVRDDRRGRQHDRLRVLGAGVGDHRRGAACRRRRGPALSPRHIKSSKQSEYKQ